MIYDGKELGFGVDVVGIHHISTATCSATLSQGVATIQEARNNRFTTLSAATPWWEKLWLHSSVLHDHLHSLPLCEASRNTPAPHYADPPITAVLLHRENQTPDLAALRDCRTRLQHSGAVSWCRVKQVLHAFQVDGSAPRPPVS